MSAAPIHVRVVARVVYQCENCLSYVSGDNATVVADTLADAQRKLDALPDSPHGMPTGWACYGRDTAGRLIFMPRLRHLITRPGENARQT